MSVYLIQSEKSYNLQSVGFIALATDNQKLNKIELSKILNKAGYNIQSIQSTTTSNKKKRKGKGIHYATVKRPKKFYVKLANGQTLDEEGVNKVNQIFEPKKEDN